MLFTKLFNNYTIITHIQEIEKAKLALADALCKRFLTNRFPPATEHVSENSFTTMLFYF